MPWYVILADDVENSLALRQQTRPDHLARLKELEDAGRVLLGGPCPAIDSEDPGPAGFSGSLIVAQFESLTEATSWAEQDPYALAGVYRSVMVKPFLKVFP